jgi:hypothetical protein
MKEESEKKLAEKKFIDIAAAKEVLTDAGMHDLEILFNTVLKVQIFSLQLKGVEFCK